MAGLRITLWTAGWIFAIDQLTKWIVVQFLDLKNIYFLPVWDPFLTLRMAWNEGINFGLFSQYDLRWWLTGLSVAISLWILWWMWKDRPRGLTQFFAGCVVGGAIGNSIDRVVYGSVADFLNMSCCGYENPWSFNVADIAIFLGAFGLILFSGDKTRDAGPSTR
jgi:signal peptidase II